jgi:site-specific DNA recombinase
MDSPPRASGRTALYLRVSTEGQRNTTSLPEQERLLCDYAGAHGWPIADRDIYREVESGADLYRPELDRLWLAIERRAIARVLVDVTDRLSRDEGDAAAFYRHCDRYGAEVVLVSEEPAETEQARTLRSLAGILARMERTEIARRTQRGRRARAAAGKLFPATTPLYGYVWADPAKGQRTRYVADPETAPVVRRIFADVAAGVSLHEVCRRLEAEGVPTPARLWLERGLWPATRPASDVWRHGSLLRILRHPAYVGAHAAYRWQMQTSKTRDPMTMITSKTRRQRVRDDDDPARVALSEQACPPLVDTDTAQAALTRLAGNKAASVGRNHDVLATIWRGLAVCGHCGARLHTKQGHRTEGGRRYSCLALHAGPHGARVACPGGGFTYAASKLDTAGWADVLAWLADGANVARLLADWQEQVQGGAASLAARLAGLDAETALLRDKMARLAESIADTADRESRRTLQARLDTYAEQVRGAEGKRARLVREAAEARDLAVQAEQVRAWAATVAETAATFTRAEQVATLRALGAEVTVWRADHVHPDGWPQRYRIRLTFTGFTGQPVTLPASGAPSPTLALTS